jgi:thioredoxin 1
LLWLTFMLSGVVLAGSSTFDSMVKEVQSVEEFDQILAGTEKLVVVDFYAVWCGPCRFIAPVLERLQEEYAGTVEFIKVDVDKLPDLAQRCGVAAMPTFIFYKGGKKIDDLTGANESILREKVRKHK